MGQAIYFDAFSGISGDMTLGALLHAGLPFDYLQTELAKLSLTESYRLEMYQTSQHGISGIKLNVILTEPDPHHRSLSTIKELIQVSQLAEIVKTRAIAIFSKLAEAEAKIHGVTPDEVHFHEVGSIDAIVDIVGSCIGFDYFQLEEFYCSPLPAGAGFVRSAHGLIPVPAPATLELLSSAGATFAPALTLPGGIEYPPRMEMVTPTGAAIVATLCRFERPAFKLKASGYGYGSKQLPWPNALRIWLGETTAQSFQTNHQALATHHDHAHDNQEDHHHNPIELGTRNSELGTPSQISLVETNLDDMTPEALGFLLERLLKAGALDVYFTPIQMKKNRPATMLSVIVRPDDEARFAELVLRESSSFGLRVSQMQRYITDRDFGEVEISAGKAKVKYKILNGQIVEAVPEYDNIAELARQTNRPWREIYEEVRQAARQKEN
jgi:uncharacterized protein (TIGR00299 family) protein